MPTVRARPGAALLFYTGRLTSNHGGFRPRADEGVGVGLGLGHSASNMSAEMVTDVSAAADGSLVRTQIKGGRRSSRCSHATLCTSLVILHTTYKGRSDNNFTAYA